MHHDPGERILTEPRTFDEFKMLVRQGSGFLGENRHLLENAWKLEDLRQAPEYKGVIVDR